MFSCTPDEETVVVDYGTVDVVSYSHESIPIPNNYGRRYKHTVTLKNTKQTSVSGYVRFVYDVGYDYVNVPLIQSNETKTFVGEYGHSIHGGYNETPTEVYFVKE